MDSSITYGFVPKTTLVNSLLSIFIITGFILIGEGPAWSKPVNSFRETTETMRFVQRAEQLLAKCFKGKDGRRCSEFDFLRRSVRVGRETLRKETRIQQLQAELSAFKSSSRQPSSRTKTAVSSTASCQYETFKRERFGLYQIYDEGGSGYVKTPSPSGEGQCYTSSERSGKEYKVFFCQNGSFVNIQVQSGQGSSPVTRQEDILFDQLDGKLCRIQTIHLKESKGDTVLSELNLTRDECERVYNNHLVAVDKVSSGFIDVKPQEELRTLGLCLKYDVVPLPPMGAVIVSPTGSKPGDKSGK